MPRILAFSGSSSSRSINRQLVTWAAGRLDTEVTLVDIRDFPLPIYGIDIEEADGIPQNASTFRGLIYAHDGIIIACPEHNGAMPAIFKNLIDWMSRMPGKIFDDRPVLLLSTSPGKGGGATNLNNLATLVPWWGGNVVATISIGSFNNAFDREAGALRDADKIAEVDGGLHALASALR